MSATLGAMTAAACQLTSHGARFALNTPLPAVIDPTGFHGQVYQVNAAEVDRALRKPGRTSAISRVGGPSAGMRHLSCHSQGITSWGSGFATSCTDRRHAEGWLQLYGDTDLATFANGRDARARFVPLYDADFAHPAVGQALFGPRGAVVFPVVHERLRLHRSRGRGAALIDIRDERGALMCSIEHRRPGGLAAAAMIVFDQAFYVVAVSKTRVFTYRIHALTTDGGSCPAERISDQPGQRMARGHTWAPYQALALFSNHHGRVFLLASHHHWLDAYRFEGFGGAHPLVEKVGQLTWRPRGIWRRGVFYEGMTIEQLDERTMRVWALPHDYRASTCWPPSRHRRCTKAVYMLEQALGPADHTVRARP